MEPVMLTLLTLKILMILKKILEIIVKKLTKILTNKFKGKNMEREKENYVNNILIKISKEISDNKDIGANAIALKVMAGEFFDIKHEISELTNKVNILNEKAGKGFFSKKKNRKK